MPGDKNLKIYAKIFLVFFSVGVLFYILSTLQSFFGYFLWMGMGAVFSGVDASSVATELINTKLIFITIIFSFVLKYTFTLNRKREYLKQIIISFIFIMVMLLLSSNDTLSIFILFNSGV